MQTNTNLKRRDSGEESSKNMPQYPSPTRTKNKGHPICFHNLPNINFPNPSFPRINPHNNNLPYNKWVPLILHLYTYTLSPLSPLQNCSKIDLNRKWEPLPYYGQTKPTKSQVGLARGQPRTIQEGSGSVLSRFGSDRWLPASKGIEDAAGFLKCQIHWTLGVHPWWPPSFAQLEAIPTTYGSSWRTLGILMRA